MKQVIKEFKEFIMRGSVLDLAVGVVIGAAFGKIVDSLVKDVIMPPIGLLLGRINFTELFINLSGESYGTLQAAQEAGAPTINYGLFINSIVNFLIVGFVIFLLLKPINTIRQETKKKEAAEEAPKTKECPYCFSLIDIRATRCLNCTSDVE